MAHPHARPTLAYTPRDPEQTLLHQVVREQLPTFLAHGAASDRPLPRFVTRELDDFLRCGVLCHGFLRLRCDDCRAEHALPFSCKRRGVCTSCAGRRMADTAAHLVDRVFPHAPTRQWVLSFPFALRYRLAYDKELCSAVLTLFLRSVFASLRRRARRELAVRSRDLHCGAVSVLQRFGDGLRLNLHVHSIFLDGVYVRDSAGAARFHPLPPPDDAEVARVAQHIARRLKAFLLHRALLADDEEHLEHDPLAETDPALAALYGASIQGRVALGPRAGQRLQRIGDRIDPDDIEWGASPRCASAGGLNLHANVAVHAHDRSRLERLARYILRPALAADRLSQLSDGRLLYRLKHPWRDGTQALLFEPLDFLGKLAALIPPARAHQVRYYGVFAARSSLRDLVIAARPDLDAAADPPADSPSASAPPATGPRRPRHLRWAELLRRVFHVDLERCPRCGGRLRVLAAILDPHIAQAILACLSLSRAPPLDSHAVAQQPF